MQRLRVMLAIWTLSAAGATSAAPLPDSPGTDQHRDALPPGALARLGTVRFRHGGCIGNAVFAADGKSITTYGQDDVIRTWEVPSGRMLREVRRLSCEPSYIYWSELSDDGCWLALVCAQDDDGNQRVRICDTATGREVRQIAVGSRILGSALSPDGKLLAVGDGEGSITVWNIAACEQLFSDNIRLRSASAPANMLAFSRDGSVLACGSTWAGLGALWDARTGKEVTKFEPKGSGHGSHLAFSQDGTGLAGCPSDNIIRLWDTHTGVECLCLHQENEKGTGSGSPPQYDVKDIAMSRDGLTIAADTFEGAVYVWDRKTGRQRHKIACDKSLLDSCHHSLAISPDGQTLAILGRGNAVRLWDIASGKELTANDQYPPVVNALVFSPDSRHIAGGGSGGRVGLWEARTGKLIHELKEFDYCDISALAFAPDGKALIYAMDHFFVPIVSLATFERTGEFSGVHESILVSALAYSPDGCHVACGGRKWHEAQALLIFDARSSAVRHKIMCEETIVGLCFSRDGQLLVSGGGRSHSVVLGRDDDGIRSKERHRGDVRLWNPPDGKELWHFSLDGRWISTVALLPDKRSLIALDEKQTLHWIEIGSGQERRSWDGLRCAALSADGRRLAVGDDQGGVAIWDLATCKLLKQFTGHRGPVRALAFSPDGRLLASVGADTTVLVWDVEDVGQRSQRTAVALTPDQLGELWDKLNASAADAADAVSVLVDNPEQALALLQKRLPPVKVGGRRITELLHDLDADECAVRSAAFHELTLLGGAAVPALRDALDGDPSVELRARAEILLSKAAALDVIAPNLRASRALELLEALGTVEARRLLEHLATGDSRAWLTQQARAGLDRLKN